MPPPGVFDRCCHSGRGHPQCSIHVPSILAKAPRRNRINDRDLLSNKLALEWGHWLEGANHPFYIYTDHKNLQYLCKAKHLNHHQGRRAIVLLQIPPPTLIPPWLQELPCRCSFPNVLFPKRGTLRWTPNSENSPNTCPPLWTYVTLPQHNQVIHSVHSSLGIGQPGATQPSRLQNNASGGLAWQPICDGSSKVVESVPSRRVRVIFPKGNSYHFLNPTALGHLGVDLHSVFRESQVCCLMSKQTSNNKMFLVWTDKPYVNIVQPIENRIKQIRLRINS